MLIQRSYFNTTADFDGNIGYMKILDITDNILQHNNINENGGVKIISFYSRKVHYESYEKCRTTPKDFHLNS